MQRICKDGNATKDYTLTWATELGNDLIIGSTWTPEVGITVVDNSFTNTTTTVRVSGGTPGVEYSVVNHITTAGGMQEDETLVFLINEE